MGSDCVCVQGGRGARQHSPHRLDNLMAAKPQLIVSDMSGYHAQNMPETISRLQRGGSWKKQRIVVVLPAADLVPAKCVLSWWNLAFPPNNGVVKILAQGMEVGDAYSTAI